MQEATAQRRHAIGRLVGTDSLPHISAPIALPVADSQLSRAAASATDDIDTYSQEAHAHASPSVTPSTDVNADQPNNDIQHDYIIVSAQLLQQLLAR